jgi:hypothetical protein
MERLRPRVQGGEGHTRQGLCRGRRRKKEDAALSEEEAQNRWRVSVSYFYVVQTAATRKDVAYEYYIGDHFYLFSSFRRPGLEGVVDESRSLPVSPAIIASDLGPNFLGHTTRPTATAPKNGKT